MFALNLDQVRVIAVVALVALLAIMMVVAWLLNSMIQKVVVIALVGLAAFSVWTQRASVQECADRVAASALRGGTSACSFFGQEVDVPSR